MNQTVAQLIAEDVGQLVPTADAADHACQCREWADLVRFAGRDRAAEMVRQTTAGEHLLFLGPVPGCRGVG